MNLFQSKSFGLPSRRSTTGLRSCWVPFVVSGLWFWSSLQACGSSSGSALRFLLSLCRTLLKLQSRRVLDPVQCWVRMWLWRRVAEENLFPHSEQRSAEALPAGGEEGDAASAAVFSAAWVWRWAFRRDIRLNLRPHSSHSDQTRRLFFCGQETTNRAECCWASENTNKSFKAPTDSRADLLATQTPSRTGLITLSD